ncbi:hypothetical protein [Neoroseomonas marina]|nr:hypothetical protein [Neoroseomonas marina]
MTLRLASILAILLLAAGCCGAGTNCSIPSRGAYNNANGGA